jgi:Uncharacterized conserved protein
MAVLIDSENVRRTLQLHYGSVDLERIIKELLSIADEWGEAIVRQAYGDWGMNPVHGRLYQRMGFQPEMVLTKESGGDRSDMEMALDAHELLLQRAEVEGFMFVTGDSDFRAVIRRCRGRGKKVIVVGFSVNTGRELLAEADQFIALDARLSLIRERVEPGTPPELDLERVILALDDVCSRLPFVHLKYFRDSVLTPTMGVADDLNSRNATIRQLVDQGLVRTGKIPSRDGKNEVTTMVLVRDHPIVMAVLKPKESA